jgi:hypothetical protein
MLRLSSQIHFPQYTSMIASLRGERRYLNALRMVLI